VTAFLTPTVSERSPPVLVLSRRLNEKIVLPDLGITVQVIEVKGNVVRLGIEAPRDVTVLREELTRPADVPPGRPSRRADPCCR